MTIIDNKNKNQKSFFTAFVKTVRMSQHNDIHSLQETEESKYQNDYLYESVWSPVIWKFSYSVFKHNKPKKVF